MPYFFHLKLELYPTPAAPLQLPQKSNTAGADIFVPPPGTDIFTDNLPAHKISKHAPSSALRSAAGTPYPRRTPPDGGETQSGSPSPHREALLLPEKATLLSRSHSPGITPAKPTNEAAARDWRYHCVTLDAIDMAATSIGPAKSTVNGFHTKAIYQPSDTKSTGVGYGIVHLYRDAEETALLGDAEAFSRKSLDRASRNGNDEKEFDPADCTTLCILAVPALTTSSLLAFLGEAAKEDVKHIRMIRTGEFRHYMVLMKFRSAKKAFEWHKANNGRRFSEFDQETAHVVFIKSVEFLSPDSDLSDASTFQRNTNDPFTPRKAGSSNLLLSKRPPPPPTPDLRELPTCPVCLERMDETTGLLTILCQHVFHCTCLEKWQGLGCPVCRYTNSPSSTFPFALPSGTQSPDDASYEPICNQCGVCDKDNLWVCLICGLVGCGRYNGRHAYDHYEETGHCYAMNIGQQQIWDYAGDGYVHRLIQNKPDSKPIDMPSKRRHENEAFRAEPPDSVPIEKIDNLTTEYTALLTSQLENQRRYYEGVVKRTVDKASKAAASAEEATSRLLALETSLAESRSAQKDLEKKVSRLEISMDRAQKEKSMAQDLARKLTTRLKEEQVMSQGMKDNLDAAEKKAKAMEEEKQMLEELNNDLMMQISSQQQIEEAKAQGKNVEVTFKRVDEGPGRRGGKGKGRGS
jgi:BRCA1-associated protein